MADPMTEVTLDLVKGGPGYGDPAALVGRSYIGGVDNVPYTLADVVSVETTVSGSKAVTYSLALDE